MKAAAREMMRPYEARTVTLVTAVKDIEHSHIPALIGFLREL